MLEADLKAQLKSYLERVVRPIEIVANLDDSKGSTELQGLLADLQACSSQITVRETRDAAERAQSKDAPAKTRTSAKKMTAKA